MENSEKKTSRLRRLLSVRRMAEQMADIYSKRPFTVVWLALTAAWCLFEIWTTADLPSVAETSANLSLALGILGSLAVYQWVPTHKKITEIQIAVAVLAVLNFFVLALSDGPFKVQTDIGYASIISALAVAVFFRPYGGEEGLSKSWRYTAQSVGAFAVSCFTCVVILVGIVFINEALRDLFHIYLDKIPGTLAILFAFLLPCYMFLWRLPYRQPAEFEIERVLSTFSKNVLLPITLVYMAILYVYGLKILFTLELPEGNVCYMVTGLTAVSLIVLYTLQGLLLACDASATSRRIAQMSLRWIPILLLPLLVLMSVAIGYRISEYGLTPSRLYVVVFNAWAYCAVLYVTLRRNPRYSVVACTFAAVFVAVSAIPDFNLYSCGMRSVRESVRRTLVEAGVEKFPISEHMVRDIMEKMDKAESRRLAEDLDFLDNYKDHSEIRDIVVSEDRITVYDLLWSNGYYEESVTAISSPEMTVSPVPCGKSVEYRSLVLYGDSIETIGGKLKIESDSIVFDFPADSLRRAYEGATDNYAPFTMHAVNDPDRFLVVTNYAIDCDPYTADTVYTRVNVHGLLFTK